MQNKWKIYSTVLHVFELSVQNNWLYETNEHENVTNVGTHKVSCDENKEMISTGVKLNPPTSIGSMECVVVYSGSKYKGKY